MKLLTVILCACCLSISACKSTHQDVVEEQQEAKKEISEAHKEVAETVKEVDKEIAKAAQKGDVEAVEEKKIEGTEEIADAKEKLGDEKVEATEEITDAKKAAGETTGTLQKE